MFFSTNMVRKIKWPECGRWSQNFFAELKQCTIILPRKFEVILIIITKTKQIWSSLIKSNILQKVVKTLYFTTFCKMLDFMRELQIFLVFVIIIRMTSNFLGNIILHCFNSAKKFWDHRLHSGHFILLTILVEKNVKF